MDKGMPAVSASLETYFEWRPHSTHRLGGWSLSIPTRGTNVVSPHVALHLWLSFSQPRPKIAVCSPMVFGASFWTL